jgi:hypothetical protein
LAKSQPVPESLYQLATKYRNLRDTKSLFETKLKQLNLQLEIAEMELSDMMISTEIGKFTHTSMEGPATIYLSTKLHASCLAAKRHDLRLYLMSEGKIELLVDTVDDKALTKYVKELLDQADELDPGLSECITVFERPSVNIRKQNSKEAKSDE